MLSKINEIIKKGNYFTRITIYILGLFIVTLGISMSVKSDFGVSPVSSIPYTITCITVLVGAFLGLITKMFGEKRDTILLKNNINIE